MIKAVSPSGYLPVACATLGAMLLVGFCVLSLSGLGLADEPPKALTPEAIARYVADLDNDSRAVRAAAEAALITAGPAVLDHLPLAGTLPDPAARESLDRVIRSIEAADFQTALQPRPVSLVGVQSLRNAVKRIEEETGNRLSLSVDPPDVASLKFAATPLTFWESVSAIEVQTRLRYHTEQLAPLPDNSPAFQSSVTGPFRVQLIHGNLRTTTRGEKLLNVKVRLTCEPRLRPLFLMAAVDEWSVSHQQTPAAAFTPQARREIPSTSTGEIDVAFDFVIPPSTPDQTLWTIAGQLDLTLAARSTSVTFSDLTAKLPITRRRGQASLSLLVVKTADTNSSVRLATAFPEMAGLFESYRASLLAPTVWLETPPARRTTPVDTIQLQEAPEGIILEYHFHDPLTPETRLTATIPTAISTQKIPFQFNNVPLTPTDGQISR